MAHAMLGVFGYETSGTKAPDFDGTQPCKKLDLEFFFPESQALENENLRTIRPICKSCKFTTLCLEWALNNRERGIWAGTGEQDRKLILRRKNRELNKKAPR